MLTACYFMVLVFLHDEILKQSNAFEDGDVRLMFNGQEHESKGRVEVMYNGTWGTVCSAGWDHQDARVACRTMGYERGIAVNPGVFGEGSGPIWLRKLYCFGSEANLLRCRSGSSHGQDTCTHAQDVGVQCYTGISPLQIRLMDGETPATSAGRVEVLFNDEWGSICEDSFSWGHSSAAALCRQLGFVGGKAVASSIHGSREGRTWVSRLSCAGSAASISSCSYAAINYEQCTPDAAVRCHNDADIPIRLMDGSSVGTNAGRVEVQYQGLWWSVCGDNEWSSFDATVICRELGYIWGYPVRGGVYGESEGRPLFSGLRCDHDNTKLMMCDYDILGAGSCLQHRGAGVVCMNEPQTDFAVRLVGGGSSGDVTGRVEVLMHGEWHSVCSPYSSSDAHRSARTACRQLGYDRGQAIEDGMIENGHHRSWLPDFDCFGSENALLECDFTLQGGRTNRCFNDLSIACWNDTLTPRPVRLISNGEVAQSAGIVEMWFGEQWNTLCGDRRWGDEEARLVCRMLGYEDGDAVVTDEFGTSASPSLLNNLWCLSYQDTDIMLCDRHSARFWENCRSRPASVMCYNDETCSCSCSCDDNK